LQRKEESENQPVALQTVPITRPRELNCDAPALVPRTVTLTAPVDGAFVSTTLLPAQPEKLNDETNVVASEPTVATAAWHERTPPPALHLTLLSDCHVVTPQLLPPTRPRPLQSRLPKFDPTTVTLSAPVVAWFVPTRLLVVGALLVHDASTLPVP